MSLFRPQSDQRFHSSLRHSPFATENTAWVRGTHWSRAQTVSMCPFRTAYFNSVVVKCATCSSIPLKKQKRGQKNESLSSPGVWTLLLTVKLTCPFRAAACIKSMTNWCGFPATTFLSTEMSSSPGRSRPSRSAGVFSIIAPITICSKTIDISSGDKDKEDKESHSNCFS